MGYQRTAGTGCLPVLLPEQQRGVMVETVDNAAVVATVARSVFRRLEPNLKVVATRGIS